MPELTISDVEAFQGASSVEAGDVEVIAYSGGNIPVVEQGTVTVSISGEPLDVSDATVTTTTDSADAGPFTARTTATSTTVSVAPGRFGDETAVHVDASGSGTLTVGVSTDGGTTVDERTLSYDSTGVLESVPGFGYVEASANQNLNALSLSAKGL